MLKNSFVMFLALFLAVGTLTFHEGAEARTVKKSSHAKVKKKHPQKHHKSSAKMAKHSRKKEKKHHKVATKMKKFSQKNRMVAKHQRSAGRKIASINKKHRPSKVKRHSKSLPKEYGSL